MVRLLTALLLFLAGWARGEGDIAIKSYPLLPAENVIKNSGFESMSEDDPSELANWSDWAHGSAWASLVYPDGATQDRENGRFGAACLRLRKVAGGNPQSLVQVVDGKDYTYAPPSASDMDGLGDLLGETEDGDLGDDAPEELIKPTHILSFWARTDGRARGRVELRNVPAPPASVLITSREFHNAAWRKVDVPFKAPEKGSALMVVLGLADDKPAGATVWYDNVSLLPMNARLEYQANLRSLARVVVREKAAKTVIKTSTERIGRMEVPAGGVYLIEARDRNGKTVSRQYPEERFLNAENIVANGGFEQDAQRAPSWEHYSWGGLAQTAKVSIDTETFKEGRQSLSFFPAWNRDAITRKIPASAYLPGRKYVFSYWAKARDSGRYFIRLRGDKKTLADTTVWGPRGWTHHRSEFRTPETPGADLAMLIVGWSQIRRESMLWVDGIAVRPLLQKERDAVDLVNGLTHDMQAFCRSAIRERLYDLETDIDLIRFDVDDCRACGVLDDASYETRRKAIADLDRDWRTGRDRLYAFSNDVRKRGEAIVSEARWHGAEAFGEELRGWRKSFQKRADELLLPLEDAITKTRASIADEVKRLKASWEQRDRQTAAEEQSAFAADYAKAIKGIEDPDPGQREMSSLELGRLQDPRAAPSLIRLLNDDCYPVRRNALYALAWMRAKVAVPAIISVLKTSSDPWTRRRATQALGMIGDRRASPVLKALVSDPDGTVRQNAVISLGWLRDKSAVPLLKSVIQQCLGYSPPTFEWLKRERSSEGMTAEEASDEFPTVDSATGEEGEREEERDPAFELSGEEPGPGASGDGTDEPGDEVVSSGRWKYAQALNRSYYTAALAVQSLGLTGDPSVRPFLRSLAEKHAWAVRSAALFALGQIGDEADETLLVKFSKFHNSNYRRASKYYRWQAANALALLKEPERERVVGIRQPEFMKQKRHFYWLTNHFHRAFGRWFSEKNHPDDFTQAMRYMGASGANQALEWFVPAPLSESKRYFEAAHENGLRCLVAEGNDVGKGYINRKIHYFGKYPAFAGIWSEEGPYAFLDDMRERTRDLDSELLKHIGERGNVDPDFRWKHREFFARHAEILEKNVVDALQEEREYVHMLRKGTAVAHYTSICSSTFTPWPTISLWGRMAHNLDINGTEPSYNTASYENAMFAELCRDGGDTCNGMEIYIWRLPWSFTRRWEIGMSIGLLHAQQFFVWYWGDIFKQFNSVGRGRPEAWKITGRVFRKMRKLEPFLAHSRRPRDLALVYSGRTSSLLYRDDRTDRDRTQHYVQNLYTRNTIGIFQALAYEHTQCDVIWADTMTPEKIKDYKVLILSDAKTLTPNEEKTVREWVRNGGSLIATGTTTMFDQYGTARPNYGLADVFGVELKESTCTIPLENIDSGAGLAAERKDEFPVDGQAVEYNVSYGYDRIGLKTASTIAEWADSGDAAVTLNRFGKGHCLFVTAAYPGLMYRGGRTIYRWPLFKHYRKGITQMLTALVRQGLSLAGTEPRLLVQNCPWYVETNLRLQPEKRRLLFQLLNYDEQKLPVQGVEARIRVPGKVSKVYYGDDGVEVSFQRQKEYVTFPIRDFDIHEAIAVEYQSERR